MAPQDSQKKREFLRTLFGSRSHCDEGGLRKNVAYLDNLCKMLLPAEHFISS